VAGGRARRQESLAGAQNSQTQQGCSPQGSRYVHSDTDMPDEGLPYQRTFSRSDTGNLVGINDAPFTGSSNG